MSNYVEERPADGLTVRNYNEPDLLIFVSTYVTNDVSFGKPGIITTTIRSLDIYGREYIRRFGGQLSIQQAEQLAIIKAKQEPFTLAMSKLVTRMFDRFKSKKNKNDPNNKT